MKKQLMWIHGLLPEDLNNRISDVCRKLIFDYSLSDRFFKIPLHISLKRSFYVNDFDKVNQDVLLFLKDYQKVVCEGFYPVKIKDRIWLNVVDSKQLHILHQELDRMLFEKYDIPIDEFDRLYNPHISLFSGVDNDKLAIVYNYLIDNIESDCFIIDRFVTG